MHVLRSVFLGALFGMGLGTSALAIPVTFTYTSNAVDFSVFDEDWESALLDQYDFINPRRMDGARATIELDVDCEINQGNWSCTEFSGFGVFSLRSPDPVADTVGNIKLLSKSGFTDVSLWFNRFKVDAAGQVQEWSFTGTEISGYGDFVLSNAGDRWEWGTFIPAGVFYCQYTTGVFSGHTDDVCANGDPAKQFSTTVALGTGTWTVDTGAVLVATPLPGGLPLVLSVIGVFAYLRRASLGNIPGYLS